MGRVLVVIGILAAMGACLFLAFAPGSSQEEPISIEKTLATVQSEQKNAVPEPPAQKTPTNLPVASKTGPWPKAVVKEFSYAFGRMQVGEKRSHTFTISNEGEADLELKTGNTTCKCTTFQLASTIVKAGESTTLEMHWKSGDAPDSAFRHGGDVHTNDPDRPVINFVVEGAVEYAFEVMPNEWSFGSLASEQAGKMKSVIMTRIFDTFDITSIECKSGKLTIHPTRLTPEEKASDVSIEGYSLAIELAADLPPGEFEDEVILKVSTQEAPIRIPVRARKFGQIRLQQMGALLFNPDKMTLNLGSFSLAAGREVKLMMIVDQKDMTEDFKIVETVSDPPGFKVTLEPLGSPSGTVHRYTMTVAFPGGRPRVQKTEFNPGSISIKTNHPSGEVITLHVQMNAT